ncbi:hypothetical protein EBBID32_6340 [Sphingobium indicum BiD32]|uniref:Uncharacterized protein n=1 Tax=Sphingobium indicum BiD32 TaxID=1301087 RepID=N1MH69_9SPHN|nr:hypothetical protein EBBID32_6340 [Sphingobium indicum BiD32]
MAMRGGGCHADGLSRCPRKQATMGWTRNAAFLRPAAP